MKVKKEESEERSYVNTQTIYIAPKSRHITTLEPVWGAEWGEHS